MSSAVVLSSGGINSAVVLEIALRAHRPDTIHMISFEYGSKSNDQERLAALDLYTYYTDRGENITWASLEIAGPNVEPFIDAILLSRATAYAITKSASYIYTGMLSDDTGEFLESMKDAIFCGSKYKISLKSPVAFSTKAVVIKQAYNLEVPINLTWSCSQPYTFNDALPPIHCGVCLSCTKRIAGFDALRVVDPIQYAPKIEWNMTKLWPYMGTAQLRAGKL